MKFILFKNYLHYKINFNKEYIYFYNFIFDTLSNIFGGAFILFWDFFFKMFRYLGLKVVTNLK